MCFRNTWFEETFSHLPYQVFEKLIEELPDTVETIFFGGMGEPFVHPNILEMLEECKQKGYQVEILTNGSLLSDEVIEKLIQIKLDRLWVSIDSLASEAVAYKKDKVQRESNGVQQAAVSLGHPNTDEILGNIYRFNRVRYRKNSTTELGITFVVSKYNARELSYLPAFISKYMVNHVNISNMYPSCAEDMEQVLYQRTLDMSVGSDQFGATRPRVNLPYMDYSEESVQIGLAGMFGKMNFNLEVGSIPVPRRSNYCRFIQEGMSFVRSDGEVSPCMALLHNGTTAIFDKDRKIYHHSFGNVGRERMADIWESDDYVNFRVKVEAFAFSPCMTCGQCDLPDSNQEDCYGNSKPTCGACLWAEGILSCP